MSDASFTGIGKLGQVAINAHDIERATAFYRDVLGMKFLFPAPKMAFFQCGEVMFMLSLPETPEYDHASSVLYFLVEEICNPSLLIKAREWQSHLAKVVVAKVLAIPDEHCCRPGALANTL